MAGWCPHGLLGYFSCRIYNWFKPFCIPFSPGTSTTTITTYTNHDMKQPRYVSLSTNILTGLLGSCILVVTSWFVYRLEYESKRVQRLRTFFTWAYLYHLRRNFHWYVRSFLDELKADRASVGHLETIKA